MKAKQKHLKKALMWYKVKELFEKGFNKSQISLEIGIHRKTVRKYLNMSEEEFHIWINQARNLPKKLNEYYEYVHRSLQAHPYLSASQIEDRLKEEFISLPQVHSKTIYNFAQSIRKQHGIKKSKERLPRQYHKLPEPDYGYQAQVDFGQYQMQAKGESRRRVYFFVMVLCRSRQKFVYFQTTPYTTADTIDAHDKAFVYFGGQPREIVYDQDRVLISDENLGDVLLTQDFHIYCNQMEFKAVFCRKSDPESKGKVENVVGYIKNNFLRGRIFFGQEELNKSAHEWLWRTGNGKEHSGTKKIPAQEWEIERNYLLPQKQLPTKPVNNLMPKYKVRKDNTISYKSNFYTLPLGTYQGQETWVLLKEKGQEIRLYTMHNELLTIHPLCLQRGMVIRNSDHARDKSQSIIKLKEETITMMPDKEKGKLFIEMLHKDKPRYVRDNLLVLKKHIPDLENIYIIQSLNFCLENNLYNSNRLIEVARHYQKEAMVQETITHTIPETMIKHGLEALDMVPQKSKLSTYETIL